MKSSLRDIAGYLSLALGLSGKSVYVGLSACGSIRSKDYVLGSF